MRILIATLLALTMSSAAADVTVLTLDGPKTGTLASLNATHIVVITGSSKKTKIPLDSVVSVQFGTRTKAPRGTAFDLSNGDRYYGKLVSSAEGMESLTLDSPSCGRIKLASELLAQIRHQTKKAPKIPPRPEKSEQDQIILKDGDSVRGLVADLRRREGGGFTWVIETDGEEEIELDDSRIHLVRFAQVEEGKRAPSTEFHALIRCTDGSQFAARIRSLNDRVVQLEALADNSPRSLPLASIASLMFQNGRFVYLTDRKPVSEPEVTPYHGWPFPPRYDLCRRGTPLRLRGRTYRKGIGMQSKTRITYDVRGFKRFQCTVGVDDLAQDGGSVVFRVYLDGKKVVESEVLRGAGPTEAFDVALKGAKQITLEADFADNAHVNDLADWVDPILIK